MESTILVTDFSEFYKATDKDGKTLYYPVGNAAMKMRAMSFDAKADPVIVKGFAVYDTTISADYAVDIYPTKDAAQKHTPSEAPAIPSAIVSKEGPHPAAYSPDYSPDDFDTEYTTPVTPTKKRGAKKRG